MFKLKSIILFQKQDMLI